MKYLCAACSTKTDFKKPIILSSELKPSWIQSINYVEQFIDKQTKMNIKKMDIYDQTLCMNFGKENANQYILYWASKPSKNELNIVDAKTAYGNFSNHGISKINSNGDVKLYFKCPQNYHTTRKNKNESEIFYRHIHFVLNKGDKWDKDKIYTQVLYCNVSNDVVKQHMKKGNTLLINSLPCEYYAKEHIPNSYNLHHSQVKKMSKPQLEKWFQEVIQKNYPCILDFLKTYSIYEVPLVLYCAHEKCNASELCALELYKKGFVNIRLYEGGMKDYRKNSF